MKVVIQCTKHLSSALVGRYASASGESGPFDYTKDISEAKVYDSPEAALTRVQGRSDPHSQSAFALVPVEVVQPVAASVRRLI